MIKTIGTVLYLSSGSFLWKNETKFLKGSKYKKKHIINSTVIWYYVICQWLWKVNINNIMKDIITVIIITKEMSITITRIIIQFFY